MASHVYRANDSRRRRGDLTADSNRLRDSTAENEYLRPTSPRPPNRRSASEKLSYYPPELGPDFGRPEYTQHQRQRPSKPKRPYQPLCEDEVPSLAKEAGKPVLLGAEEIKQRGTIDQEPVILDVPGVTTDSKIRVDARHKARGILTPETSEDEREKPRREAKLTCSTDDPVPEISQRSASPYAFTKGPRLSRDVAAERFLSPDTLTPPNTDSPGRRARYPPPSSAPSSPCSSPSTRKGSDYFSSTPTREAESSSAAGNPYTSGHVLPLREPHFEGRRFTDTNESLPTVRRLKLEKGARPTPLVASSALSELGDNPGYTASPNSIHSFDASTQRPGSQNLSATSRLPSSTSPRLSVDGSAAVSSASSKAASVSGSRPPSPRASLDSPRIPKTDLDWSNLLAANAARRRAAARPATLLRQETMPEYTRPSQNPLPYPLDDGPPPTGLMYMPSEYDHAASSPTIASRPSPSSAYEGSSSQGSFSSTSNNIAGAPPPSIRTSNITRLPTTASPATASPRLPGDARLGTNISPELKREMAAMVRKGLPQCSRIHPKSGYDDWYTIIGANDLDICPRCVDAVFERTIFRTSLRRSPPRSLATKIQCALGSSPWVRLAWTLTLKQQKTDLALLKAVAEVNDSTDECPGHIETACTWYGLRDLNGLLVRDFYICHRDAKIIERLLPSLVSIFVLLPSKVAAEKHICAFRADSNRLPEYLEVLTTTHEKAISSGRAPDPMPIVGFAEHKTRLRECTRDNLLLGAIWHYPEQIPEFTVCEDCFDFVIEPEIRRRSEVALSFNRTLAPAYGEGMGSSCQLYSPYMRKCFQRAVRDRDFKYLSRKAKERREVELKLQTRYKDIMRRYKRLSRDGDLHDSDERRIQRELEKISDEWSTWE